MWQARCLGPHCRETSRLLKTLSSRKAELLQALKVRMKTGPQSETKEPKLKSPIMKSTVATTPPFLQTPSCGLAGKSWPYARSALIAPSYFRQLSGRGDVRPHFLGRGVLSRNITHLAPLRLVELEHCPAKSEPKRLEGSPKATANGVIRDATDLLLDKQSKRAEQQIRFQSNQAVQRQEEAFQDFEEFGRLWPQGSDVRGKLREFLAREKGNGELAQRESGYWQKRRGRDWGLFEKDRGSARQEGGGVTGAVGQILDEREEEAASAGTGEEKQVEDEGRTEGAFGASSSRMDSQTLGGEAEGSVPGVQGDRSPNEGATSASAASVSLALSEGGLETLSEPDVKEEEDVGVAGAEAPESSEARGDPETQRGRPPVPHSEKRHWAQLRRRQHKMEAMALNNAVERYAKMLKETQERGAGSIVPAASRLVLALYEPLRREIEHERSAILRGERSMDRQNYGPYFLLLDSEKLAVLTIHCVLSAILAPENKWTEGMAWRDQRKRLQEKGWVKVVTASMELGQAVEAEANLERMVNKKKLERMAKVAEKKRQKAEVVDAAKKSSDTSKAGSSAVAEGETVDAQAAKEDRVVSEKKEQEKERVRQRKQARAGVEAVMRAYFPDCTELEVTKQGYRLPTVKELRAAGRHRVNLHARNAIEFNTDWGNDIRAKVGAALISIFLRATEVSPTILETKRRPNEQLVRAITQGKIDGVTPEDTPSLVASLQNSGDGNFSSLSSLLTNHENLLEDSAELPETAARLEDPASSESDSAQRIEASASESIEDSAETVGGSDREASIQETIDEVKERMDQDEERRRKGGEAGTSKTGKRKKRGRNRKEQEPLQSLEAGASASLGGDAAADSVLEGETPDSLSAGEHAFGGADAVGERSFLANLIFSPILTASAVQTELLSALNLVRSTKPGAEPIPTGPAEPVHTGAEGQGQSTKLQRQQQEDEMRALALERAITLYGQEWGHLSVPKKGKPMRIPAFRHTKRMLKGNRGGGTHKCGVLEVHPAVLQLLSTENAIAASLHPRHMPMIVPPRPWSSYNRGGHLLLRNLIMRTRGSRQQVETLKKASYPSEGGKKAPMQPVFEALNALGNVPWKINMPVAGVVEQVWELCRQGEGLAGLPTREKALLPQKPEEAAAEERTVWREYKRALQKARQANSDLVSQCSDMELKLATMREIREEERFYFPHTLDFRGRAYPLHPYLNHLGSDVCRGLLMFGEGRPLGERGLRWLKIHLANLVGNSVDKLSFDEREKYCNDNLEEIMDSADRPLEGRRWWMAAEDPFQALAACFEITAAERSGDPPSYICSLPVHQDGSCNGLQHYAALGKDVAGAEHVNMVDMERPADVYTGIADKVKEKVDVDAAKGMAVAIALKDHVDRKLVKQTVMTSVYGVTFIGARNQIKNRLKEKGVTEDEALLFQLSMYATKVTLNSLGELFTSARAIMTWLGQCAHTVAGQAPKGNEAPVTWTTPLGLPVVQPYMKRSRKVVQTILQSVFLEEEKENDEVHAGRQKSAFAPNYVHSLDATHMMMTATACRKKGLAFAGVHDSYWTHPGDVEQMNEILREKFIELHSAPLLENLLAEFKEKYPDLDFPAVPNRGEFDVQSVRHAPYFFD